MDEQNMRSLLCALLDCGVDDLRMLSNFEYDFYDILQALKDAEYGISLNNILMQIFTQGKYNLEDALEDKILEYKNAIDDCSDKEELDRLQTELIVLSNLNPSKDVIWYVNWSDSHVYLSHLGKYEEFMHQEISIIEDNMGFEFEDGGDDDE